MTGFGSADGGRAALAGGADEAGAEGAEGVRKGAQEGGAGGGAAGWRWDLRSVNGKSLDVRLRTPSGWERAESVWRARIAERFKRGSISAGLTLSETLDRPVLRLDPSALGAAIEAARAAAEAMRAAGLEPAPVAPEALLGVKGVLAADAAPENGLSVETDLDAITATLDAALDALAEARAAEGDKLRARLTEQVDAVAALTDAAAAQAQARRETVRARLAERVAELSAGVAAGAAELPEERLAQELALLAVRADVSEEIDRLRVHIASARELFDAAGPIGRKLEFLTQEFAREANTLCSKSQDAALTDTGLKLKVAIDQIREQAANVQ